MSADAWQVCPQCLQIAQNKKGTSYGKVSEEEYLRIVLELDALEHNDTQTLREDYEMWTNPEGVFFVFYACSCSVCKFDFEYKYEKNLFLKGK